MVVLHRFYCVVEELCDRISYRPYRNENNNKNEKKTRKKNTPKRWKFVKGTKYKRSYNNILVCLRWHSSTCVNGTQTFLTVFVRFFSLLNSFQVVWYHSALWIITSLPSRCPQNLKFCHVGTFLQFVLRTHLDTYMMVSAEN